MAALPQSFPTAKLCRAALPAKGSILFGNISGVSSKLRPRIRSSRKGWSSSSVRAVLDLEGSGVTLKASKIDACRGDRSKVRAFR